MKEKVLGGRAFGKPTMHDQCRACKEVCQCRSRYAMQYVRLPRSRSGLDYLCNSFQAWSVNPLHHPFGCGQPLACTSWLPTVWSMPAMALSWRFTNIVKNTMRFGCRHRNSMEVSRIQRVSAAQVRENTRVKRSPVEVSRAACKYAVDVVPLMRKAPGRPHTDRAARRR